LLEIVVNASPISKVVLGILAIFSVVSWAIVLLKWWAFLRPRRPTATFL